MKRKFYAPACALAAVFLAPAAFAEEITVENAPMNLADVLVSSLYFIGALALIYLILVLVSKWGKKHPDNTENDSGEKSNLTEKAEAETKESPAAEKEKENTDE